MRELEATGSPPSKEGTRASLTATVEGLRSELHTTLEIVDLVASGDVTNICEVVSKKVEHWRALETENAPPSHMPNSPVASWATCHFFDRKRMSEWRPTEISAQT